MASSVGSRPNHYDVLGVRPTATQQEIAEAFGKAMGMFGARPMATAAQLGAAFEVLRNPAKRRAYDQALGLAPESRPQPRFATYASQWNGAGFIGSGWKPETPVVGGVSVPRPAPEPAPLTRADPPTEPRLASFIAASLRDIARPVTEAAAAEAKPAPRPNPKPEPQPQATPEPVNQPHFDELPWTRVDVEEVQPVAEARPIDWKRLGLVVGGLVLGAGLIGALAGSWVKDDVQARQIEPAVSAELPAARPAPAAAAPLAASPAGADRMEGARPVAVQTRATPAARGVAPLPSVAGQQLAEAQPLEASPVPAVPAASEQLAADPLAPQPVAASFPLPNAVAARTIERIGYACGQIASASAIEGRGSGVFKITCTSGQSYRAAPVHGRYRFKRLGGQ